MTSAVPDASVVSQRSATTDRASRPTGLRAETSGFAAMMDEASPEPRASANQTRPSDRVQAADKAQAASETPISNKPASASDESAPAPDEAAPASTETGPVSAAVNPVPGEIAPILTLEGGPEEALAEATDMTAEAAIADVPLAAPAIPADPSTMPATAVPVQAAPEASLPDLTEQPPLATAAPVIASATDSTKPVAASPAPTQAAAVAPAIKMATTISADESGAKIVDPADTAPAQSGTAADTATLADGPKQPTQAGTSANASQNAAPARPEATPDKPAPQPEIAAKPDDAALATKPNIDASSQVQLAVPAHSAATHAATPHAMPVSAAQPVPADAIAVEIASQARAGNSRFEIRLDPPELGRIDVRLDVDRDGNVKSRLVIERADTYDLLRRDQSTLERALQQAGLKTSDHALEFSLRDQGFAHQRNADDEPRGTRAMIHEAEVAPSEAANGYARLLGARGGIDIRV